MSFYIFLGLLNGICIALSRIVNGQLSSQRGPFYASYINHIVGFAFLSVLVLGWFNPPTTLPTNLAFYSGGIIGALYVAINSLVMTKVGSTNAIVLVIAGQMILSLLLDFSNADAVSLILQLLGVSLIVGGVVAKELIAKRGLRKH